MIRFHKTDSTAPNVFMVTARRRPRGYVFKSSEVVEKTSASATRATWTTEVVEGWRAMGLNGYAGSLFPTRRRAAHDLVSNHRFTLTSSGAVRAAPSPAR